MFSKHLGTLPVRQAGEAIRDLGFDGVDLTVRPGGHVKPEEARASLPRAVRELRELGLRVPMLTTAITSATDPHAEALLATAAAEGVREIKLGYWAYTGFGSLRSQLDAARKALEGLEALARRHEVRVSVHIHSGRYLSAQAASIHYLLSDRDPRHVGAYIDPGHMTLEGMDDGWRQGLDLLQGRISMVAVKSFGVFREQEAKTGDARWKGKIVPLKEGSVRWREVFGCLKQLGWNGTLSLHSEYQGSGSWRDLTVPELIIQTREDLSYLRPILRAAGY